ncbi:hypothetical protein [Streptosporangium sp. V21-05]|uniref:hypothetical protein n=1 Tax=Streptosporangium sp. V21-05 TaxID=3446115 RepID=UPI003F52B18E
MVEERWHVSFTQRGLPVGGVFSEWLEDLDQCLDQHDVLEGTPFLLSPTFEYDVAMNEFFVSGSIGGASLNTLEAYARDMAGFFTFLWTSRGEKSW